MKQTSANRQIFPQFLKETGSLKLKVFNTPPSVSLKNRIQADYKNINSSILFSHLFSLVKHPYGFVYIAGGQNTQ